jgi:hypothetical protein
MPNNRYNGFVATSNSIELKIDNAKNTDTQITFIIRPERTHIHLLKPDGRTEVSRKTWDELISFFESPSK